MESNVERLELPGTATPASEPFPEHVRSFAAVTPWRFAKTYAATWPHEYVVRNAENAPMVLALARHIFDHGIEGRFYGVSGSITGKVYWQTKRDRRRLRDYNRHDCLALRHVVLKASHELECWRACEERTRFCVDGGGRRVCFMVGSRSLRLRALLRRHGVEECTNRAS